MTSWRPPAQNVPERERCWFEACYRAHCSFCGCGSFILHLSRLAARFNFQGGLPPPGGPQQESPPVLRALPAPSPRRHTATENPGAEQWPTGGGVDGGRREGDGGAGDAADEYRAEDIDDLFAAIEGDLQ